MHELVEMPLWELRGWSQYLAKVMPPDLCIEAAIVRMHASYIGAHQKQGASPPNVREMMLSRDPWAEEAEEMAVFNSIAAELMKG